MAGTPLKNLRLFDRICGDNYNNIILTTTMWDEVETDEGEQREKELMEVYWKSMIKRGSKTARFFHTQDSALKIIQPIIDGANEAHALLLQQEVTDLEKELPQTEAGKTLYMELQTLVNRHNGMLARIRRELQEPKLDEEQLKELTQEYQKISSDLKRAMDDMQKMKGGSMRIGERLKKTVLPRNFFRMFDIFK